MSAARKDPAVHVSLSSYSLVKQPGDRGDPRPSGEPEGRRSSMHPRTVGCWFTVTVRSFRGAQSHRERTARRGLYIGRPALYCQPQLAHFPRRRETYTTPRLSARRPAAEWLLKALPRRTQAIFMVRPYRLSSRDGIVSAGGRLTFRIRKQGSQAPLLTAPRPAGIVQASVHGLPTTGTIAVR